MKKIVLIFTLIATILLVTSSYIFATDTVQNDAMKATDGVRNVVGGAENVVENVAKDGADGIKNGINTVGNTTSNLTNATTNNGNYTATRTATETGTNTGVMNNAWTWIIVAIIAIVIIAVIWYYSTRSNDRD